MEELQQRAGTLIEALPYIQQWSGKTVVVKYGGAAMTDPDLQRSVAQDLVLLRYVGINVVVVHGGGARISQMMARLGMEPQFVEGLRVTDAETMEIAQMVLVGGINQEIVSLINAAGGQAVGISGKDANMIIARKKTADVDLGFVGEVADINPQVITTLTEVGYTVVVSSVGTDSEGQSYNINADTVAGHLAAAVQAIKLIILSDVPGLLENPDDPNSLISELTANEAENMLKTDQVGEGMVPKLQSCLTALAGGVQRTHLIDGRLPHSLLMELFTDAGIGTMIHAD